MQSSPFQLDGIPVIADQYLAGTKAAYFDGETILVSPAIFSLMAAATPDELMHLFKHLPIKHLPRGAFRPKTPFATLDL
jgi:hypothetical protein